MHRFISLASHPGKTGTYFYNRFFNDFQLTGHHYTALACVDLQSTINTEIAQGHLCGISISMPFKKTIIPLLNKVDDSVKQHNTCNTVLVDNGKLIGYNADLAGAEHVLSMINDNDRVTILGNGSIGSMIHRMINGRATMFSRSLGNWEERHQPADVIINATAAGTSIPESPLEMIPGSRLVIDLATKPGSLANQCLTTGTDYVGGLIFYKYQFIRQFNIYTGISIDPNEFDRLEKELTHGTT
jgi:shikimate 5-dehydrogenase